MPLSEQEQRLLDEMERHLMRNDADVVSAPGDGRSLSYRNIVYGAILVLAGLGSLIVGVATDFGVISTVIGVAGFVLMIGGVILAITPVRGGGVTTRSAGPASAPRASQASFMDRMNDRWDRRQEGRQDGR